MDYGLAKQLKDAGFIQKGKGEFINEYGLAGVLTPDVAYSPTLSELIEACGDRFGSVCAYHKKNEDDSMKIYTWTANCYYPLPSIQTKGDTPNEAVAKLWLALNSK